MNFYNLHTNPKSLDHHDVADEIVPNLAWEKHKNNLDEMKKRESLWAKSTKHSYEYAGRFLKGPFKLGEPAIAKSAEYSYRYAKIILKGPFKLGEPAIAKHPAYSCDYSIDVLHGPFKLGELAIAKHSEYSYYYAMYALKLPPNEAHAWKII